MRVALLNHNARAGDALGNALAEKLVFFLDRGADIRAFIEDDRALHPDVRPHCTLWLSPEAVGPHWEFVRDCDLVIAEFGQFYTLMTLLPLLFGGKPRVLIDYHGVTPPDLWGLLRREVLEKGVRHRGIVWCADAVLVHSNYARNEILQRCEYPEERLHPLGFAVETEVTNSDYANLWRRRLGLERAQLLLFVGRLAPNKRVPLLIEAVARLRDLEPPVHALIVGDDADFYATEARRCRELADQLGVAERIHFLGHLTGEPLRESYRAADVFVMPSLWESFCIPVIEAMAHGVPVVAARAAVLPETVGNAGLTFQPDRLEDLERQLRRILNEKSESRNPKSETNSTSEIQNSKPNGLPGLESVSDVGVESSSFSSRVAVVSVRYGDDFAGGAEKSLRGIAETLHQAGCRVEVFTTCTRAESRWGNDIPEGTSTLNGIRLHRFRMDAHDRSRHLASVRAVWQNEGSLSPEVERDYLRHTIHSSRLVDALLARRDEFDAVIVGPYLFGLTHDVAASLPDKTLLLPCFHDEPFARMRALLDGYERVGGILYHSPEEQQFAEVELGLNHPGATCIGTWLDLRTKGNAEAAPRDVGGSRPYLVYCGRYSRQKDVPLLIEYARRYDAERLGRFILVFLGQGEVIIPDEPWTRDLGFVGEESKRDLIAGAAALVQLSRYESLSLAALEAWAQGVPVIARRCCAVLTGHLERNGAGCAVESYEEFADALDSLWDNPERWQTLGRQGLEYVRGEYGQRAVFAERLLRAVNEVPAPLVEKMRRRGRERAAGFSREIWRQKFAAVVEHLLHAEPLPYRHEVEVRPRGEERRVAATARGLLIQARVVNRGTHLLLAEGPGRTTLHCRVVDEEGRPIVEDASASLPGPLMPGRALSASMPVPVPRHTGTYRVGFWAETAGAEPTPPDRWLRLVVQGQQNGNPSDCGTALESAQAALVEAVQLQRLPDDYTDVTEGRFAALKLRIKRKLLGNFKHGYVDVLSRQQSGFNRQLLAAVQELAECCAALDHANDVLLDRIARLEEQLRARSRPEQAHELQPVSFLES